MRAKVSQPLLGEMRLRWWTDALTGEASEGTRAHPVADALLDTIACFDLPRDELVALADAHVADLYDDQMPDMATLDDYCRMTAAGPIRWAARILGASPSPVFDEAGLALGLTRILRMPAGAFHPRRSPPASRRGHSRRHAGPACGARRIARQGAAPLPNRARRRSNAGKGPRGSVARRDGSRLSGAHGGKGIRSPARSLGALAIAPAVAVMARGARRGALMRRGAGK